MVRLNRSRIDYLEKFQQMIDEYNAGAINIDEFFKQLVEFAKELSQEEKRSISEQLSDEELAMFDLLTKPKMKLTSKDKKQVKKVARELLETLKREKLVLDWRKRQQSRAAVILSIEYILSEGLPPSYSQDTYKQKCDLVYQHVFEAYYGEGRSIYSAVS
jgi:type I restriction enzyme R subunit